MTIQERVESLRPAGETTNHFLSYLLDLWYASTTGAVGRVSRVSARCTEAQMATLRNLSASKGAQEASWAQMEIVSHLCDEWREEVINAAQIYLMTGADLNYWQRQLSQSWSAALVH